MAVHARKFRRILRSFNAVKAWIPLSVAINSIQRSMGEADLYPFLLTAPVVSKLEFIRALLHGKIVAVSDTQQDVQQTAMVE